MADAGLRAWDKQKINRARTGPRRPPSSPEPHARNGALTDYTLLAFLKRSARYVVSLNAWCMKTILRSALMSFHPNFSA